MSRAELAVLRRAASQLPEGGLWVEVGVWHGRSAHCVALALPTNASLYLVDDYRGVHGHDANEAEKQCRLTISDMLTQRPDLSINKWKMTSAEAARKFNGLNVTAQVVFIDADHSEKAVTNDCEAWEPLTKILMGHDYSHTDPGVIRAIDARYKSQFHVFPSTSIWKVLCKPAQEYGLI